MKDGTFYVIFLAIEGPAIERSYPCPPKPASNAPHLSCLTLDVKDLGAARRFYEALGFKVGFVHEDVVFFRMQGSILALYVQAKLSRDLGRKGAPRPGGMNPAVNLASPRAVDNLYAKAVKAGGPRRCGSLVRPNGAGAALASTLWRGAALGL